MVSLGIYGASMNILTSLRNMFRLTKRAEAPEEEEPKERIPATVEDAIETVRELLRKEPPEAIEHGYWLHHGYGMHLRNAWGLWGKKGSSPLVTELNSMGLFHADDMSGLIISQAIRDIHGKPRDIESEVKVYQEHWRKAGVDPSTEE